jgi:hypothetical protein
MPKEPQELTPDFIAEDTKYRLSLLDKNNLPKGLTRPTQGISRSTDVYGEPKFIPSIGGVHRRDYNKQGVFISDVFIPAVGVVKDVTNEETPEGEQVFLEQKSAYEFHNTIKREKTGKKEKKTK